MKAAPNMQDVARAAGYSRAAVSMALRGDLTIPEKTRQQIAAIARQLGYRPNPMVAALMSLQRQRRPIGNSTTAIAYLTSQPRGNFEHRRGINAIMAAGAAARAQEFGYRLEPFNLRAERMTPARMREILVARHIHAVVIAPLPGGETELNLDLSPFAVVGLGMSVASPLIERVTNDHFQSVVLAVNRCADLGYRRIGLVLSKETSHRLEHRWLGGYRLALAQRDLGARVLPLMTESADELPGAMPAWLRQQKPDVVLLCHVEPELLARVPLTMGLVGLAVEGPNDQLTGIFQDYALLGRVAVEHAVAKLYTNRFGPLGEAHLHLVAGSWVSGSSAPGPGRRRPQFTERRQ